MADKENAVRLRVAEALQDDAYKGIARMDMETMKEIGVKRGDIVLIKGQKETVAIVDRAYPADVGEGIIRIDGILRRNAKTGVNETVTIMKADVKEAKKILIAPAQKGIMVQADAETLRGGLLGRAVVKGDILVLGGVQRRRDIMGGEVDMDEIFGDIEKMFGGVLGNFGGMGGFGKIQQIKFVVANTNPNQPVIITENTEVQLSNKAVEISEDNKVLEVTYEDIGGLTDEVKKIREMVELPLKHPEIFDKLGIEPPKGVLLHGPPGTGKTLLARAVASETESNFILLNGPEIMSKFYGESEKKVRDIFEDAEKNAPSIIFIDEIDAIAPKREDVQGEVERRVVSQLLTMMDGLKSRGKVVVIGATNRPNSIDPALRRPGRFDREVEISVPDKAGRLAILKIHTRNMPIESSYNRPYLDRYIHSMKIKIEDLKNKLKLIKTEEIKNTNDDPKNINDDIKKYFEELAFAEGILVKFNGDFKKDEKTFKDLDKKDKEKLSEILLNEMLNQIASVTHGFVGADLSSLAKEAAMAVIRKVIPRIPTKDGEEIPEEILKELRISDKDFDDALKVVRPSAMREVLVETPNVNWNDVGGLDKVKQELKEAVEWPLKFPDSFKRMGIRPPRGLLLYGPPGTGKTLLAKAVAKESEANFIQVKGPALLSMWVGESEKGVRKIFERARQVAPCIIFFDEVDSLAGRRGMSSEGGSKVTEHVLNQLLAEMDGIEENSDVVVLAATNRPDILDPAILRPGRFDRILLVGPTDKKGRLEIFKIHTKGMPLAKDVDIDELAEKTDGYVGSDIDGLCREAAMLALRKNIDAKQVSKENFEEAMNKVKASITKADIEKYKKIEENYLKSAKAALESSSYLG
jgi:transitional endoplasmic reticulum ATPase